MPDTRTERDSMGELKVPADALYAAQRKRQDEASLAVSGDESLRAELAERETKLASLNTELAAAQSE